MVNGIGPLKSASVALIVILGLSGFAAQQPDASVLLAAARQALGGDAKLNTVTSLSVTGSMTQDSGPITIGKASDLDKEQTCARADVRRAYVRTC